MVVHQQNPDHRGTSTRTTVPVDPLRTDTDPPTCATRDRIAVRPNPRTTASGSKP